jgi:beta-galactosidase/beta-glucuronidase
MPCRWTEGGLKDFAGRVRFRRRFGYPGRIDDHERVWLTIGGVDAAAEIWLNGHSLGRLDEAQQPFECNVTGILRDRNELRVEVECPETGGLWGEVALEIRLAN